MPAKNLIGYRYAHAERHEYLKDKQTDGAAQELMLCGYGMARIRARYCDFSQVEKDAFDDTVLVMSLFAKQYIPLLGNKGWDARLRLGVLFPHFIDNFSFAAVSK